MLNCSRRFVQSVSDSIATRLSRALRISDYKAPIPPTAVVTPDLPQATEMEKKGNRLDKFLSGVASMFNEEKYSDTTVLIHGVTLHAHRLIICLQSPYFTKALKEAFVEGSTGAIEFQEGSGIAHWRVFEYLYTGNYSDSLSNKDFEEDPELCKDLRVYVLADMFFLEDLKALALEKFKRNLEDLWMSDSFPECVREVYKSTYERDHALRSVVVEVAATHAHDLGSNGIFKDLVYEGGDFVVDYFEKLLYIMEPNE
ncbi:hypothetical protein K469DRAFT_239450 [Zopfia rhizophila CBS 207.26]|uniref:BTB domain-containing protein n=1 Tax=Zopfia rhizophila CBS 207.26 TaxID=1314779 RepID=A0A6A6ES83_9PEZI|nr:hypothetical protein K469DRAFT_239450 [Zopfia rhizophila CBS 207.26]